jgi:predicted DNA repair protein MutK
MKRIMNTVSFYGTGGWVFKGENMKPLYWNSKKGRLQTKPPLTIPEKLLFWIVIPFILSSLYAIGSKYAEGVKQGRHFVQIVNS